MSPLASDLPATLAAPNNPFPNFNLSSPLLSPSFSHICQFSSNLFYLHSISQLYPRSSPPNLSPTLSCFTLTFSTLSQAVLSSLPSKSILSYPYTRQLSPKLCCPHSLPTLSCPTPTSVNSLPSYAVPTPSQLYPVLPLHPLTLSQAVLPPLLPNSTLS